MEDVWTRKKMAAVKRDLTFNVGCGVIIVDVDVVVNVDLVVVVVFVAVVVVKVILKKNYTKNFREKRT